MTARSTASVAKVAAKRKEPMKSRADILEQLIELDEVLPEIEMGSVPEKPFGTVSVLGRSIIDGELIIFIEGESKPVNVSAVDFGSDLPPEPDFEQWEIEGMCQDGGCEVCNPDLTDDYDEYYRGESTEDMLWRKSSEDADRIAELESKVRNLEWQLRCERGERYGDDRLLYEGDRYRYGWCADGRLAWRCSPERKADWLAGADNLVYN
tara:strand:- start:499 stop:1125 length:627 start_codon:yes stop_codon:yes gene_type:complete